MNNPTPVTTAAVADELNLLDLLIILASRKRMILWTTLAFCAASVVYCIVAKPVFEGKTTLLPPQQQNAASALMSQLGGLAGGLGSSALGLKNPADIYVAMLQSDSIALRLIERFKLQALYNDKTMVETIKDLNHHTDVVNGKDGLMAVTVQDEDPKRAAALANAYVEELQALTKRLATTEAGTRRMFFEQRLKDAKDHLADAEVELKRTQEKTGVLQLEDQGRASIQSLASIKAQIAAKEVQLQVMGKGMTDSNPDYTRTRAELSGLNQQLQALMKGGAGDDDVILAKSKAPEVGLTYVRKLRDVKYYETLFELLARQYEMARLDEANQGAIIQVVDYALPPEKKARPKRALVVLLATVAGLLLSIVAAFVGHALSMLKADPAQAERLAQLRSLMRRG